MFQPSAAVAPWRAFGPGPFSLSYIGWPDISLNAGIEMTASKKGPERYPERRAATLTDWDGTNARRGRS